MRRNLSPRRRGSTPWRSTGVVAVLFLALPGAARAELALLDEELDLSSTSAPALSVDGALVAQAEPATVPGGMDFDLLGEAKAPPDAPNARAMRWRRKMLTAHQAMGFGLVALQLGTTAVGQLGYSDRFADGPQTAKWDATHAALAYSTLGVFAVNGLVALLAPSPVKKTWKMDRVMVHRIAMFTAAAGMLAQGALGIYTREREGYVNQERIATAHLAIGYVTLAAVGAGVGVLVF
jgi:hypothetical protein